LLLSTLTTSVTALGNDAIGTFAATNDPAIESSVPNKSEFADYYFYVRNTNAIPSGGTLIIEFPEQFAEDLGISGTPSCKTYICSQSGRKITISITPALAANSTVTLVVYNVQNPSATGGTGPFEMSSYKGINLLDQNKAFGVVGVAGAINSLASASVAIQSGSSKKAGEVTRYEVAMKVQTTLPMWSWLRFSFPASFTIAKYPTCEAYTINGKVLKGNLICEQDNNKVKVYGIAQEVFPNTEIGVRVSVTNPPYAGSPGTFTVETGRNSTNTVYERKANIASVVIEPGQITGVRFGAVDSSVILATSKPVLYNLKFVTANTCEQGGKVEIEFSSNFNMNSQTIYYLEYGLEDISASKTVKLTYSSSAKKLTITDFKAFTNQQLSLILQIANPPSSGDTTPLIIRTYKSDGTTRIDENSLDAKVTISTTSAPDITTSYPGANTDQATGSTIDLQFTFIPQKPIPRLGYIKIKIPSAFTVTSASLTCTMKPKNIGIDNANSCTYVDGVLTFILYSSTAVSPAGNGDFIEGVDSYIRISTGITAPTVAGSYVFDFNTYDASLKIIESGTSVVTLTAKQVTGATFDLIHTKNDISSVVTLSFTPNLAVPSGVKPSVTTELQGFIEISLPTQDAGSNDLFRTDLGLSLSEGDKVPCLSLSGLSGTLTCVLSTKPSSASNTTPAIVTVSGFTSITASTSIVLTLAGVKAMQTNNVASVTVITYSKFNRIRTNINSFTDATSTGTSTGTSTTLATSFTFSSTTVSSTTNLSPSASFTTTVASTTTRPYLFLTISPVHDLGYCYGATISCTVDSVSKSCYCYSGLDAVLIDMNSVSLTAASHTFTIAGLVQPESVPTVSEYAMLYICGASSLREVITFSTALPTQTADSFTQNLVSADRTAAGSPYVTFSFTLQTAQVLPNAGQVEVLFPTEYVLSDSSPGPTCSSDILTPYTASGFGCSIFNNRATMTNIATVPTTGVIRFKVAGVKNPSSISGTFTLKTMNSSARIISQATGVSGITLTSTWTPGTLSVSSIAAFPTNAKQKVEYTVTFTPTNTLPKGSIVSITYPLVQFGNLPLTPTCRISGALNTIEKCTTEANIVKYVTDEHHTSGSLTFSLYNVDNFDAGTSNEFSVSIMYDSVVTDQTVTGSSSLKATSTAVYSPLKVTKIDFDPRNEGEVSTYLFNLIPAYSISTDTYVTVLFPSEFDRFLGESLTCWSEELLGSLTCSVIHERMLQVKGHLAFTACTTCQINLYVYGVVNPMKRSSATATSNVQISLLQNNRYIESNLTAGTFSVLSAPGYNNVLESTLDNYYSRYDNIMKFNMTTSVTIPTMQYFGAIWVRYPADYELTESTVSCNSTEKWADGAPDCEIDIDRVKLDGQQVAYVGNMYITLSGIPNPIYEVTAHSVTISTYDGLNKKILERSYPNLNPTRFKYTFPGPVIKVNLDKAFSVDRGTMSDFIPITLDYPCALNLTLTPSSESGLTFVPAVVYLDVGEIKEYFRVSVPEDTDPGTYYIRWTILGDVQPNYYTPISKTRFTVVKTGGVKVWIDDIPATVKAGKSLPVYINLQRAPDVDLTVSVVSGSQSGGYSIEPGQVQFVSGETSKPFYISVSKSINETLSSVELSLSGTNVAPYSLEKTTYEFPVSLSETRVPSVSGAFSKETGRTKVVAQVAGNNVAHCYYAYALRGSTAPTFEEAKDGGPATYATTQTVYGQAIIGNNLTADLSMFNLTAETKYTLYMWLEDTLSRQSEEVFTYDFETLSRYPAAEFSLYFAQTYLNNVEVDLARSAVSLLLSLKNWRVIEKNRETTTAPVSVVSPSGGRRLTEEIRAKLTLYVIDDPASDVYPKPKDLIEMLQTRKAKLSELVNNLDTTYSITGSEVYMNPCSFTTQPTLYENETDYQQISVQAVMPAAGHFYAVLMKSDGDPGKPRSLQISEYLNALNVPVQGVNFDTKASVSFNVTFSELTQLTEYNIYATCGNNYPVFPDMLDDTKVVSINWKTDQKPSPRPLNTDFAAWMLLNLIGLLAFL